MQKQSAADYYATKQFEFKPSGENVNLSIKIKRIKTKNADMDIDTDIPFGTNPGSKMALDHYLSLLENTTKVTYAPNKIETDKRHPNANILPTRADAADDISKHCDMYDGMNRRNDTSTIIIEREIR